MADENEGGGIDLDAPEVKAAIAAQVAEAEKGLKTSQQKAMDEAKGAKRELDALRKQWDGLDAEQVRSTLDKLAESDDAKKIADGKIDEVIAAKIEREKKDHERAILALQSQIEERDGKAAALTGRLKSLEIDTEIMQAIQQTKGFIESALPDALARAHNVFDLDDNGKRIARDASGNMLTSDDDPTQPIAPKGWIEKFLRKEAPHMWAGGDGQGLPGAANNGAGGAKTWPRSEYEKLQKENPAENDRRFAAGWTVRDD